MANNAAQTADEVEYFRLRVITPQRQVYEGKVVGVYLSAALGDLELLPRREPILTPLRIGPLVVRELGTMGEEPGVTLAVHGGFLDMNGTDAVVYASSAEIATELDLERARESEARARERLAKLTISKGQTAPVDADRAEQALARALLRLRLGASMNQDNA